MQDLSYGEIKLVINVGELSLRECSERMKKRRMLEFEETDETRWLNMQPVHERDKNIGLHKVG